MDARDEDERERARNAADGKPARVVGEDDRFRVGRKLGEGSFGYVYVGRDAQSGRNVALKFEKADMKLPQLEAEYRMYKKMAHGLVPRVHWFGESPSGAHRVLAMELMGKSLEDLKDGCPHRRMSLKTTLMLADQMIARLAFCHSCDIVHRDVKPDNFLVGTGKRDHLVFLIDFGLSKRMRGHDGRHAPYKDGKQLTGTPRYASVNAHMGVEQSRRDDMESVGYILLYFLLGRLPWQGIREKDKDKKHRSIGQRKRDIPLEVLCKDAPKEFAVYLHYCRALQYTQEPDYAYLRRLFRNLFRHHGFMWDFVYDWSGHGRQK